MAFTLSPPPEVLLEREQVTNKLTDRMTRTFRLWLLSLTSRIQLTPNIAAALPITGQSGSIGSTSLQSGTLTAGLYRLTYYVRITTAATVSSSLTVTFGWTDGGISCGVTSSAVTGNTTATTQSGSIMLRADQGTSINYSTTYASIGGVSMTYRLDLVLEQMA